MEQKTGFKEVFLRLVAIVGLIAVLVLGAWGIILLAFNVIGFFNGTNTSISSLFTNDKTVVDNTATTTPVYIPVTNPPVTTTYPTTAKPTVVYTPAAQKAPLYGLPDLRVTIMSVNSLSSTQGRTVVQFVVENIGTNIAARGWNFNAILPLTPNPSYTYQAAAQQALYPGDKIAFTLTYDNPNYNQYPGQPCTLQYPNYNCNYNYGNNYNYNQYQQPQTCYTYNGYQNIPYPCDNANDSGNPNYNYYNQYQNNNQNYYGSYHPYGGTVTITVDPQNWVPEAIEYNNTASKSF